MKYAFVLTAAAVLAAGPALAGGKGSLVGSVVAPVTTAVSGVKLNALNNVGVLGGVANGASVASGNKVTVNAPVTAPINVSKNRVLNGLIGGAGHGCGCN